MLRPLGNRCLVERIEEESKLPSGIIIPESHKEKPLKGKVLAVGSKCEFLITGDVVIFGKYAGTEVQLNNNNYLVISEDEIMGIKEV